VEKIRIGILVCAARTASPGLCRKEGINQNLYYRWSKDFLEAGKKRQARDKSRVSGGVIWMHRHGF
jgi:transposase